MKSDNGKKLAAKKKKVFSPFEHRYKRNDIFHEFLSSNFLTKIVDEFSLRLFAKAENVQK
jgi:hypothetical protein